MLQFEQVADTDNMGIVCTVFHTLYITVEEFCTVVPGDFALRAKGVTQFLHGKTFTEIIIQFHSGKWGETTLADIVLASQTGTEHVLVLGFYPFVGLRLGAGGVEFGYRLAITVRELVTFAQ